MKSKYADTVEKLVFAGALLLWLTPIWAVDFFVTGDGPCHLYNSKILLDWFQGNKTFYEPFYFVNRAIVPNWLFNLLTMPLLAWFAPATAEKLFLSGYVLAFGFGFRFALRQINPSAVFLASLALLLCQNRLLMMGFYNNCLSLVGWFWLVGLWWKYRDSTGVWPQIGIAFCWLLAYLAHPMGLGFAAITIGALLVGLTVRDWQYAGFSQMGKLLSQRLGFTVLSVLPSAALFLWFAVAREWTAETGEPNVLNNLEDFGRLSALVSLNMSERPWTLAIAVWLLLVTCIAVVQKLRLRNWQAADALFLLVLVAFWLTLLPPRAFSGGLEVGQRMQLFPYFALLFWMAVAVFPPWVRVVVPLVSLALGIGLVAERLPTHRNASDLAREVYECQQHIAQPAVVMALNYDYTGQTPDGRPIADKMWLFGHVDCYIGAAKSAILSDNYEASYGYFPMIWRWQTGLPGQTDKDGINFYHRPPRANLLDYNRRTGQNIDYVLLVSYRDEFAKHAYTVELFDQLNQAFEKVYESPHKWAILYRKAKKE